MRHKTPPDVQIANMMSQWYLEDISASLRRLYLLGGGMKRADLRPSLTITKVINRIARENYYGIEELIYDRVSEYTESATYYEEMFNNAQNSRQ